MFQQKTLLVQDAELRVLIVQLLQERVGDEGPSAAHSVQHHCKKEGIL